LPSGLIKNGDIFADGCNQEIGAGPLTSKFTNA